MLPKAPRRAGAFDRRIAAAAFTLGASALLCTVAVVRPPLPELARRDPTAARDLVALMRAGEHGSWAVTYDFVRTLADGRALRQPLREARHASLHVLVSGSSMTFERGDRTYDCNVVESRSPCIESTSGRVLAASEVLRVAVAVGAYDVTRRPAVALAGERARCFRVAARRVGLPDLGVEVDLCLAGDGIPLAQRVVRASGAVDERSARSVDRHVTTRTIEALVRRFGPKTAKSFP